ncbi:MAG: hypothetical protein U0797_19080 [Gemmataceae bacterium]
MGGADAADRSHDPQRLAGWSEFHAAIEKLPAEEREVFDLLWYHELPQAEAAGAAGCVGAAPCSAAGCSARRLLAGVLPAEGE